MAGRNERECLALLPGIRGFSGLGVQGFRGSGFAGIKVFLFTFSGF